uniref:Immunoglobulin V-set domain-containing protein n=1 Tax=Oncorhynchus kisutch TaxID=8019 RepID=A0A8C7J5W6_ONCKI
MKSTRLNHFTFLILSKPDILFLKGPSAETSVFVLKGQDVRLNVQTNVQLKDVDVIFWKFNRSDNVVMYPRKVTFERYRGRAELIVGDFSLLLKNLQEEDSGLYDAVVSGINDRNVFVYLFSEKVEPPVLTVNSVSSINGTCNVTVTCRGQNTSVTSSCNSSTCSQVGGESRGAETSTVPLLSVYVAGGSIICNHCNQVSWANDTKEIVELCPLKSGKTQTHKYCTQIHISNIIPLWIESCVLYFFYLRQSDLDSCFITEKVEIHDDYYQYFASSGFLFEIIVGHTGLGQSVDCSSHIKPPVPSMDDRSVNLLLLTNLTPFGSRQCSIRRMGSTLITSVSGSCLNTTRQS